jgi:hypothetical protein
MKDHILIECSASDAVGVFAVPNGFYLFRTSCNKYKGDLKPPDQPLRLGSYRSHLNIWRGESYVYGSST